MSPSVAAKSSNSTGTTSTASMRSANDSTTSTSTASSSASTISNSASPISKGESSSSKPPSTASASTQTSPADIRLSAVGDEDLSLWASTYAPIHWIPTEMRVSSSGNSNNNNSSSSSLEKGSKEELDKRFGFVHVQPKFGSAWSCDRYVRFREKSNDSSGFRFKSTPETEKNVDRKDGDSERSDFLSANRTEAEGLLTDISYEPFLNEQWTNLLDVINVLRCIETCASTSTLNKIGDDVTQTVRLSKKCNLSSEFRYSKMLDIQKIKDDENEITVTACDSESSVVTEATELKTGNEVERKIIDVGSDDPMDDETEADSISKEELERQLEAEKTCATCGRKFATKKSRLRHEVSHSSLRPFACEYCGKTFKLKQAVCEHQRNLHPFQYLATKETNEPRSKKLRRLVKVKSPSSVAVIAAPPNNAADHEDGVGDDDDEAVDVIPQAASVPCKLITCHFCDERVLDKKDYEDHIILAHGSANDVKEEAFFKKCPICSKSCKTPGLMKLHMRDAHSDPFARFECEFCGQKFKKKTLLTQHVAYRHKERSVSCPHCDKVYATVYDLKRHAVHHDESLKPRCSVCQRVFTTKLNLRKHMEKYHETASAVAASFNAAVAAASSLGVRKSRAPVAGQVPVVGQNPISGQISAAGKGEQFRCPNGSEGNEETAESKKSTAQVKSTTNATELAASGATVVQRMINESVARSNLAVDIACGAVAVSESLAISECGASDTNSLPLSSLPILTVSVSSSTKSPTTPINSDTSVPMIPATSTLTSSFVSSLSFSKSVLSKSSPSSFALPATYAMAPPTSLVSSYASTVPTTAVASSKTILTTLAPLVPSASAGVSMIPSSSSMSSMPSIISTPSMTEVSTAVHAFQSEPQLATLELVSSNGSDEGTSLTLALQPVPATSQRVNRSMPMVQSRNGKFLQLSTLIQQPSQQQLHHSFATSQLQFASTSEGPALVFTPTASPVLAGDGTFQQLAASDPLPIGHVITAISLPTESIEENPSRY